MNMYHNTKRHCNSYTSGTSCTILINQYNTGQDGGPAVHCLWSSSSLVSAPIWYTQPLPLLITTCHLLPKKYWPNAWMQRMKSPNSAHR